MVDTIYTIQMNWMGLFYTSICTVQFWMGWISNDKLMFLFSKYTTKERKNGKKKTCKWNCHSNNVKLEKRLLRKGIRNLFYKNFNCISCCRRYFFVLLLFGKRREKQWTLKNQIIFGCTKQQEKKIPRFKQHKPHNLPCNLCVWIGYIFTTAYKKTTTKKTTEKCIHLVVN